MSHETDFKQIEILGIGDAMVDLSTHATQLPPRGGNIWSSAASLSPGGTTANISADIAKLGLRSSFFGCLGDDIYGHYVVDEFQRAGVDTRRIIFRQGTFTGIVLGIIDQSGERTFIACAKGASHTSLNCGDLEDLDFRSIKIMHTTGVCLVEEPSRSALIAAMEAAHKAGCTIYFDPNLRLEGDLFPQSLREAVMKAIGLSDIVLIADNEMELLFRDGSFEDEVDRMRSRGVKLVAVKQGEKGATLFSWEGIESFPAFRVVVNSTAGAGDSFDAGFIAARVRGASLHDAMAYACAVAAIKVTGKCARSVPNHAEVMTFLAGRGYLPIMEE